MAVEKYSVFDKIASAAKVFLKISAIFLLGFCVAQMDSVKRTQKALYQTDVLNQIKSSLDDPFDRQISVWREVPHALQGGALLIGAEYSRDMALLLVDEEGHVLHRWFLENRIFNADTLKSWTSLKKADSFSVHDAALLPTGDVIFIQTLMDVNNFRGQRLARMDRDSHIVWQVPGNFHHFISVSGDRIYTMSATKVEKLPEIGPKMYNVNYLEDTIEIYTLDGQKVNSWSVVDAFARSPYKDWLTTFELDPDMDGVQRINMPDGSTMYDLLHMNSIQYLDAAKAKALPQAQEGDLLVSFRGLSAIAVFRPSTREIVWAGKGPFRHQHNVQVEDDGVLYMYDNEGKKTVTTYNGVTPVEGKQTRVISYNPMNGQMKEIYGGLNIYSAYLGYYHPLGNGFWIINTPQHASVIIISPTKEIVWKLRTVPNPNMGDVPPSKQISTVHYYPSSYLDFLHSEGNK